MPETDQDKRPSVGGDPDLLENLLVMAAEKAAQKEAEDALKKGFVTREQINQALATFGDSLETRIVEKVEELLSPQISDAIQKASTAGERKSTIMTQEEERDADPVAYLIKKGRTEGPEAFDDVDKRIIWAVTHKALTTGMEFDNRESD